MLHLSILIFLYKKSVEHACGTGTVINIPKTISNFTLSQQLCSLKRKLKVPHFFLSIKGRWGEASFTNGEKMLLTFIDGFDINGSVR